MLAGRFSPYILGERYRAFLEVTQAHGLPADTRHIKLCDPTVESAAEACLELLSRQDRPTAIFGGNDVMAAGAMKAALRLGLRVPEDLAVTGLDDSSACGMLEPGAHLRPHRLPPDGGVERGAAPGAAGRGDGRPPGHGGAHRAAGARLQLTRTLEKYRMPRVRGGNSAMRKNEEERI